MTPGCRWRIFPTLITRWVCEVYLWSLWIISGLSITNMLILFLVVTMPPADETLSKNVGKFVYAYSENVYWPSSWVKHLTQENVWVSSWASENKARFPSPYSQHWWGENHCIRPFPSNHPNSNLVEISFNVFAFLLLAQNAHSVHTEPIYICTHLTHTNKMIVRSHSELAFRPHNVTTIPNALGAKHVEANKSVGMRAIDAAFGLDL